MSTFIIRKAGPFKPTPPAGAKATKVGAVEAPKEAKSPKLDTSVPTKEASASAGDKGLKWGQPSVSFGKERYPNKPNNSIGETKSTWVLPEGQKPQYSKDSKTSETEDKDATAQAPDSGVSTSDTAKVAPTSQDKAPEATAHTLLAGGEQKTPEDHRKLAEVATKMGHPKVATKHTKLADAKAKIAAQVKAPKADPEAKKKYNIKVKDENKLADDVAREYRKELKDRASKPKSDMEVSMAPVKDQDKAKKDKAKADAKEVKQKHSIKVKDENKLADNVAREYRAKLKERAADPKTDMETSMASVKDQEKDKKDKAKAEAKEVKATEKVKQKLVVSAQKQKAKNEKQLDKDRNSKDEKVRKEAEKEYSGQQKEKARKKKAPSSPEAQAAHALHTSKASEAKSKANALLNDPDVDESQKAVIRHMLPSFEEASSQKHEPNGAEKKQLNNFAGVVDKLHKDKAKAVKDAKKESDNKEKADLKDKQGQVKAEVKANKDKEKAAAKEAKEQAKNQPKDQQVDAHAAPPPRKAADKTGMGAYHSGRALGESASSAGAADSPSAIGARALGGVGNGAAKLGHKLTSSEKKDDEDKTRYTVSNKKQPSQSSMAKSLWVSEPVTLQNDEESLDILKSITADVATLSNVAPSSEVEFLVQECGCSEINARSGQVILKGHQRAEYTDWLCRKTLEAVTHVLESV